MFYVHHNCVYFQLHPYFPRKKLVEIFKKYLKNFLYQEYSLNPFVRESNKLNLEYELTLFSQLNPDFGKREWVKKRNHDTTTTTSGYCYVFNDRVVNSSEFVHERQSTFFNSQAGASVADNWPTVSPNVYPNTTLGQAQEDYDNAITQTLNAVINTNDRVLRRTTNTPNIIRTQPSTAIRNSLMGTLNRALTDYSETAEDDFNENEETTSTQSSGPATETTQINEHDNDSETSDQSNLDMDEEAVEYDPENSANVEA